MRLCIRAQDLRWFSFALSNDKGGVEQIVRYTEPPESLLQKLMATLKDWEIGMDALTSLAIVNGPGSATALRMAVSQANTITFVQGIAVAAISALPKMSDKSVFGKLAKARANRATWIVPEYTSPPHITKSKK